MKQWNKVMQVLQIAHDKDCEVFIAGDVFDTGHVKDSTITKLMELIKISGVNVYAIAGNHDLPGHNLDNINNSAIGIMFKSGLVKNYHGKNIDLVNFGEEIPKDSEAEVLVYHELIYKGKEPFPGAPKSGNVRNFIKKIPDNYKLILTGDNHQQFIHREDGKILVNPGSLMRMTATQEDHEPAVFHQSNLVVQKIPLKIQDGVITRDHIEKKKDKENRSKAFIKRMKDTDMKLDFRENMTNFISTNKIKQPIADEIWESIDG
jgi:DNA repair exonuclease SbcCD nuclease subunit